MQDCMKSELRKYSSEPLNHLVALVMSGASFPRHNQELLSMCRLIPPCLPPMYPPRRFYGRVLIFLTTLSGLLMNLHSTFVVSYSDQHGFRQMIQRLGHNVGQGVYASTCVNALRCIASLDQ
jgi:hypothetical protein